jgi:hypothetical protein
MTSSSSIGSCRDDGKTCSGRQRRHRVLKAGVHRLRVSDCNPGPSIFSASCFVHTSAVELNIDERMWLGIRGLRATDLATVVQQFITGRSSGPIVTPGF